MTKFLVLFILVQPLALYGQKIDSLNTAKKCLYMKEEERDMVYEINLVRTNPKGYIKCIDSILKRSEMTLKTRGKGQRNYALTFTNRSPDGKTADKIDTTWNYENVEEVKAIRSLIKDLKTMKPLPVLQPDSGIYLAMQSFSADQDAHKWELLHTGSKGDSPWDRIIKFSPKMKFGNENGAGASPKNNAFQTVIQLLLDCGIPGYGHRYNLLDPQWTHVSCLSAGQKFGMHEWIQNFGVIRK
ncbi:MAG: hypothetical protein ABIX01_13620 [Chitinophagaceae bacterium]